MPNPVEWTKAEDEEIRRQREAGVFVVDVVIEGRSRNAINLRVAKLNLGMNTRHWKAEEDAELVKKYATLTSIPNIARQMKKTDASVRARALKLGLIKRVEVMWPPEDEKELRNLWAVMGPAEISRRMSRSPTSIQNKARRLGLPSKRDYYPTQRKPADRNYESVKEAIKSRVKPRPKPVAVEAAEIIPLHARPWLTRKRGECAYPHGERGNIHSCCKPTFGATSWCEGHASVCLVFDQKAKAA